MGFELPTHVYEVPALDHWSQWEALDDDWVEAVHDELEGFGAVAYEASLQLFREFTSWEEGDGFVCYSEQTLPESGGEKVMVFLVRPESTGITYIASPCALPHLQDWLVYPRGDDA